MLCGYPCMCAPHAPARPPRRPTPGRRAQERVAGAEAAAAEAASVLRAENERLAADAGDLRRQVDDLRAELASLKVGIG